MIALCALRRVRRGRREVRLSIDIIPDVLEDAGRIIPRAPRAARIRVQSIRSSVISRAQRARRTAQHARREEEGRQLAQRPGDGRRARLRGPGQRQRARRADGLVHVAQHRAGVQVAGAQLGHALGHRVGCVRRQDLELETELDDSVRDGAAVPVARPLLGDVGEVARLAVELCSDYGRYAVVVGHAAEAICSVAVGLEC